MLKFRSLTIKNFMSIGNVAQTITLNSGDLVLVLGENLDLGGNDNRNGVGKTSLVNALSYALFGRPLVNIKMDNLINKANMKHMMVSLSFEISGQGYTIQRGRKPNIFKFIKEGDESRALSSEESDEDQNESQGENRHTQEEVERTIGFSHDMFKHILALNTYVEPFLSMDSPKQRVIIEQLLGITKLSEKAERLKEEIKLVKEHIKEEEIRINAVKDANRRTETNIQALNLKSQDWIKTNRKNIDNLRSSIIELNSIDIEKEIAAHHEKSEVLDLKKEYDSLRKEYNLNDRYIKQKTQDLEKINALVNSLTQPVCPVCSQSMDQETHHKVHADYQSQQSELAVDLEVKIAKNQELESVLSGISDAIPPVPETYYKTVKDAYDHKSTLNTLEQNLAKELESTNPYLEQIDFLKVNGLQEIDLAHMNELVRLRDHQEFLLKLLTSKDSFIRKNIIDQNLTLLNQRLSTYLKDVGLPHAVKFKSDLEVEISLYGKEFDFDNLSRGERTRLILSLSWSFRDVFESMNEKINLLFIDELIDSGLDTNGVESSLSVLKKMSRENKRSVYLISHRDELTSRVDNVMKIIKEGGFTTIAED